MEIAFNKFLRLEAGQFFHRRNRLLFIVFYVIFACIIQSSIGKYKNSWEEIKKFAEHEKSKVNYLPFYGQYRTNGFRLLYCQNPLPPPFSNDVIFSTHFYWFIDTGEGQIINESFNGKSVFARFTTIFFNLTGWLFFLGPLLFLFLGRETFKHMEFIRFLIGTTGCRKAIFGFILLTRLLLLLSFCLVMALTAWILYLINGVFIDVSSLFIYFLAVFLMVAFFLLMGMIAGTIRDKSNSMMVIVTVWVMFAWLLPVVVRTIGYNRAESIMTAEGIELKTFKLLRRFEKKVSEQVVKWDKENTTSQIRQQVFNDLWDHELKELIEQEQSIKKQMENAITLHHKISLIFPTSFFLYVNDEISGWGYHHLFAFYEHVLKLKIEFFRNDANKKISSGENTAHPYFNEGDTVYYAPSLLPGNIGVGIGIAFFWLVVLGILLWVIFNRLLVQQLKVDKNILEDPMVDLKPEDFKRDRTTFIWTYNSIHLEQLLENVRRQKISHVFVPNPGSLPGEAMVMNLLKFFGQAVSEKLLPMANCYVNDLPQDYKALLLLEILKSLEVDLLIFNNFFIGVPDLLAGHFATILGYLKRGRKLAYFSNALTVMSIVWDDAIILPGGVEPFS